MWPGLRVLVPGDCRPPAAPASAPACPLLLPPSVAAFRAFSAHFSSALTGRVFLPRGLHLCSDGALAPGDLMPRPSCMKGGRARRAASLLAAACHRRGGVGSSWLLRPLLQKRGTVLTAVGQAGSASWEKPMATRVDTVAASPGPGPVGLCGRWVAVLTGAACQHPEGSGVGQGHGDTVRGPCPIGSAPSAPSVTQVLACGGKLILRKCWCWKKK